MKNVIFTAVLMICIIVIGLFVASYIFQKPQDASGGQGIEKADGIPITAGGDVSRRLGISQKPKKAYNQESHPLLMTLFFLVLGMQMVALFLASYVIGKIRRSKDPYQIKLRKLENADIFLDLPLYIGLFGTVASFIIIALNPQIGRLLAYSSTLVGIIISVLLRVFLLFPFRQELLDAEKFESQTPETATQD